MKNLLLSLLLLFGLLSLGLAQTDDQKEKAFRDFRVKIHQLEIYNMLLPIVMKKDQVKTILREVEKARAKRHEVLDMEYKAMEAIEQQVDDALTAAGDKGVVPGPTLINQLTNATKGSLILYVAWVDDWTDNVYSVVIATLDKGQQATMAKSLNPKDFPGDLKKPEEVSDADRIRIFIKNVLLDPDTYDVLVKMSI
jgi:hypothetical protein